jgi:hypothetical protein
MQESATAAERSLSAIPPAKSTTGGIGKRQGFFAETYKTCRISIATRGARHSILTLRPIPNGGCS